MSTSTTKLIFIALSVLILAACAATAGVKSKGDGLYTINVHRGDASKVKLRAYQHAERFCVESSNQDIIVIKDDLKPDPTSQNSAIMNLDFKCGGPVTSPYGKEIQKELSKTTKM